MDIFTFSNILKFSLIVALINIDNRNLVSLGISRPIIVGAILGYLTDNICYGIFVGCIIELILINSSPIGAFIPPNGAVITGVAMIISYYFHAYKTGILLPIILIYALFWGHVTKRISRMLWSKNIFLVERFLKDVQALKFNFSFYNLMAILIDYVVYFIVIFIGSFIGIFLFKKVIRIFNTSFFINFILERALYYLPLLAMLYILNSFDVRNKKYFLLIGIISAFLLNLITSDQMLIVIIIGFFSYIFLYSIHFYREHSYEL